ncbi:MAG: peptide chain release factor N(5)-glutamine methyltransferase, partial [Vulcanimicrobiaceae bacterium]
IAEGGEGAPLGRLGGMTVATALAVGIMRLRSQGAAAGVHASAAADARLLLSEIVGRDRDWLIAHAGNELDVEDLQTFGMLLEERMRGVPVAYLTHGCGFYGREFYVDERVLVPRPETENLLEAALADLRVRASDGEGLSALDVGTGCGALAITLAAELPKLTVTATDVASDAIDVAKLNAGSHDVAERISFAFCDTATALGGRKFDCIVANLPYIPSGDIPMPPDPIGFEPRIALDGGHDGLDVYRRLALQLGDLMASGAGAYFEAAPPTIEGLAELIHRALPRATVRTLKDYAGLNRFVAVNAS